jgi:hypothetical protein
MRTKEQIDKIKQTESDPVQLWNVVTQQEINDLLNHYHSSDNVIEKSTGPKVLKINLDEGLIDNIVEKLKYTYGDFTVRNAHIFDVSKPHIIHNDDDFDYPQVYKGFVVPLYVNGPQNKTKFFVFDQYYYGGPAKFVNGLDTTDLPIHYNEFITDYTNVEGTNDNGIHGQLLKELTHLQPEWLEGLSVRCYFPWTIGSVISFDCCNLHSAGDFTIHGIKSKIGLSIFTQQ